MNRSTAERLDAFKARLKTGRIVGFLEQRKRSLHESCDGRRNAVNLKPGVGWIRGDQAINPKLLQELEKLQIENTDLRQKLAALDSDKSSPRSTPDGLADPVAVELLIYRTEEGTPDKVSHPILLGDLFAGLYGHLLKSPSEAYVRELIGFWYRQKLHISDHCELSDRSTFIRDKLEALGLIKSRSIIAGFSIHIAWSLTEKGRRFSQVGAHTNRPLRLRNLKEPHMPLTRRPGMPLRASLRGSKRKTRRRRASGHCGGYSIRLIRWCARKDSNLHEFLHCHLKAARLPIPPRALKSRFRLTAGPIDGADLTKQWWRDKAQRDVPSPIEARKRGIPRAILTPEIRTFLRSFDPDVRFRALPLLTE